MIKKLNTKYIQVEYDRNAKLELASKINELVDAVNSLIKESNIHEKQIDEVQKLIYDPNTTKGLSSLVSKMENVDPYDEQRKWIGKLCRCWDSDINDDIWGILQDIKDNKTEKYYLYGIGYEHCEPVKSTDSIIYKGGNNEK